jgi:hypothetical protein
VVAFFRSHDLSFRIRRLRFLAEQLPELPPADQPRQAEEAMRDAVFRALSLYLDLQRADRLADVAPAAAEAVRNPGAALAALGAARDLKACDDRGDAILCEALGPLPKAERRRLLLAYLGFPFYDIATLPLIRGDLGDEFNPVKVDRIAPDDATAIRAGGADATLKGVRFHSFGAFFSRAYRENDYLWGRLHGADRLIDIVVSTLPPGTTLPAGAVTTLKTRLFRAIVVEERSRLTAIPDEFDRLDREIG